MDITIEMLDNAFSIIINKNYTLFNDNCNIEIYKSK